MSEKCPECGAPWDHIPLKPCLSHMDYFDAQDRKEHLRLSGRPWSQKIEESKSFEEMREHLRDYFWSIET